MKSLLLSVPLAFLFGGIAQAQECMQRYHEQAQLLRNMDLTAFDRTNGKGWRVLADASCFAQAERLIQDFQALHDGAPSLDIHLGQMQLRQEKRAEAARSFKSAVRPDRADAEFKYNDFVLALAAYAERNRAAFEQHMSEVQKFPENFGNKMNLRLLHQISDRFDESYLAILAAHAASLAKAQERP